MSNSVLFIALAYTTVFIVLALFIFQALHMRRKYLKKLYYEGFLDSKDK